MTKNRRLSARQDENEGAIVRSGLGQFLLCGACLLFLGAFFGCSSDTPADSEYLVKINDFRLTKDAFDAQLKFEAEVDEAFQLSKEKRSQFLENLIQKQLLIQEAKKQKLDEREKFRQTIERYWQSTLIRDLLTQKGEEFKKTTVATEEEAAAYYQKNKDMFGDVPFSEVSAKIRSGLEEEKVAARLNSWIEGLRTSADIDIRDAELKPAKESEKK